MSSYDAEPQSVDESSALAIASVVVGALAFVCGLILIGALFGLLGLLLGVLHLAMNKNSRGLAWAGIGLSIVGICFSVAMGFAYVTMAQSFLEEFRKALHHSELEQWKGVTAPEVTFKTIEGETILLRDLKGKRVVLDFWATWCSPCVREIPHFVELRKAVPAEDLVIIGISEESADVIKAFSAKSKINYPMVSADNLPAPFNGISSIPTTFFIDRNGVIQDVVRGYHEFNDLRRLATSADFDGPVKSAVQSELIFAETQLMLGDAWAKQIHGATQLTVGDWNADGHPEILVNDAEATVHVIDEAGAEMASMKLPEAFQQIELGRHKDGPLLLAYSTESPSLKVFHRSGDLAWEYPTAGGIDGAHWGDLDGDENDEVVIGLNGAAGLHLVSSEGKLIWESKKLENVGSQVIVSATSSAEARVIATDTAGQLHLFDGKGSPLRTIPTVGNVFTHMAAARQSLSGPIQILVRRGQISALDENGTVEWTTPATNNPGVWGRPTFAWGDIDGDGATEWLFVDVTAELIVVNLRGEMMASLEPRHFIGFAIVSSPGRNGLIVTLSGDQLRAMRIIDAE